MRRGIVIVSAVASVVAMIYAAVAPQSEKASADRLASLVKIAAESSRAPMRREATEGATIPNSAIGKLVSQAPDTDPNERDKPRQIAGDQSDAQAPRQATRSSEILNLAQAPMASGIATGAIAANQGSPPRRFIAAKSSDDQTRRELAALIQAELRRVGCFEGETDGHWNAQTQRGMKSFIERVNASLPVNEPDYILLTLLQGHVNKACGKECPTGQALATDGRCLARAVIAQSDRGSNRQTGTTPRKTQDQSLRSEVERSGTHSAVVAEQGDGKSEDARHQQRLALEQRQLRIDAERRLKAEEARQKQAAVEQQKADERAQKERLRQAKLGAEHEAKLRAADEARQNQKAREQQQAERRADGERQRLAKLEAESVAKAGVAVEAKQQLATAPVGTETRSNLPLPAPSAIGLSSLAAVVPVANSNATAHAATATVTVNLEQTSTAQTQRPTSGTPANRTSKREVMADEPDDGGSGSRARRSTPIAASPQPIRRPAPPPRLTGRPVSVPVYLGRIVVPAASVGQLRVQPALRARLFSELNRSAP